MKVIYFKFKFGDEVVWEVVVFLIYGEYDFKYFFFE